MRLEIASLLKQVVSELKLANAGSQPMRTLPGALIRRDNPERLFEIKLWDGPKFIGIPIPLDRPLRASLAHVCRAHSVRRDLRREAPSSGASGEQQDHRVAWKFGRVTHTIIRDLRVPVLQVSTRCSE